MLFVLPTLLSAALIAWGFDVFNGDDDNDESSAEDITVKDIDTPPYETEVRGTNQNDVYESPKTGDGAAERIFMGAGDDRVESGAGFDALNLGTGDDIGISGDGKDKIFGGDGDDLLNGGRWNDYVSGGEGNDVVLSQKSVDSFNQFVGNTSLQDSLTGKSALKPDLVKDFLSNPETSDGGNDLIEGGAGRDLLMDSEGRDRIYGDDGKDVLVALDDPNTDGADNLRGGAGEDELVGDDGDTLYGGGDKDKFWVDIQNDKDQTVAIKDWEPKLQENIVFELHSSDSTDSPKLDYEITNNKVIFKLGNQVIASVETADGSAITEDQVKALAKVRVVA